VKRSLRGTAIFAGAAMSIVATSAAWAADLPVRQPAYNWTGCYIGGHGGYTWADEQWDLGYLNGTDNNQYYGWHATKGVLGGGQVGCNYQTGAWVFGLEGDFSWTNAKGDHADPIFGSYHLSTKLDWIATATGRLGMAFDRSLLYVMGGRAWDSGNYNLLYGEFAGSDRLVRSGWTFGAGWEYGLTPNWSLKIEYNYIAFRKDDVWWEFPNNPWSFHVDQKMLIGKAGINYRFGGP